MSPEGTYIPRRLAVNARRVGHGCDERQAVIGSTAWPCDGEHVFASGGGVFSIRVEYATSRDGGLKVRCEGLTSFDVQNSLRTICSPSV